MRKVDDKQAVMQTVHLALQEALKNQDIVRQEIDELLEPNFGLSTTEAVDHAAKKFFDALSDIEPVEKSWLPPELNQIPDREIRGALGIYYNTLSQLEHLQAIRDYVRARAQSN